MLSHISLLISTTPIDEIITCSRFGTENKTKIAQNKAIIFQQKSVCDYLELISTEINSISTTLTDDVIHY